MNKVALIFTGGTIAMKVNKELHGAIPSLSPNEIIGALSGIDEFDNLEVFEFSRKPSPSITPSDMKDIAMAKNKSEVSIIQSKIEAIERGVYDDFDIIGERFLGDKKKAKEAAKPMEILPETLDFDENKKAKEKKIEKKADSKKKTVKKQ